MQLTINVLISTLNHGIQKVPNVLQKEQPGVTYIIVHQFTEDVYKLIPEALLRSDVRIEQVNERGLSRSRNRALALADADIAIIADDDVQYFDDSFEIIRKAYIDYPDADVICFKIKTPEGSPEYKAYIDKSIKLKRKLPHYLSSIEITFKVERVRSKNIKFDCRFGLGGSMYASGEEDVFADDCMRKGLATYFISKYIVLHPLESSSKSLNHYSSLKNELKGALYTRKYGLRAFPKAVKDTLFDRKIIKSKGRNLLVYFIERCYGMLKIVFSKSR